MLGWSRVYIILEGGDASDNLSNFLNLKFKLEEKSNTQGISSLIMIILDKKYFPHIKNTFEQPPELNSLGIWQLMKMSNSPENVLEPSENGVSLREISKALPFVNVFR